MELGPIAAVATPILGSAVQYLRARYGSSPQRRQLVRDLDLYAKLPEGSNVKQKMLTHIETTFDQMMADEATKKRNVSTMVIGLVFIVAAIYLGSEAQSADSWGWVWWTGTALTGIIGIAGFAAGFELAERDERGNVIGQK